MNARILLIISILLLSVSVVYAAQCPEPKHVTADKTYDIHLSDKEEQVWHDYGKSDKSLTLRVNSQNPFTAREAADLLAILERIRARIQSAKDQNRLSIARMLDEKCKPSRGTGGAMCNSRAVLLPEIKEEVTYIPDGIRAASLKVYSKGEAKCEYQLKTIAPPPPGTFKPTSVPLEKKVPDFDCNNIPFDALFSREYKDTAHKMPIRLYYWNGYEIRCIFKGGNNWEILKMVVYQSYISSNPVTGVITIGKIEILNKLPGGHVSGIIARTDGRSPTRVTFNVWSDKLRPKQMVRFTTNQATGVAFLVEPLK